MIQAVSYGPPGTTYTLQFVPKYFIGVGGTYNHDGTTRFYILNLEKCTGAGMTGTAAEGPTTYNTEINKIMSIGNLRYIFGSNQVTLQQPTMPVTGWLFYK